MSIKIISVQNQVELNRIVCVLFEAWFTHTSCPQDNVGDLGQQLDYKGLSGLKVALQLKLKQTKYVRALACVCVWVRYQRENETGRQECAISHAPEAWKEHNLPCISCYCNNVHALFVLASLQKPLQTSAINKWYGWQYFDFSPVS